jgi:TIGR03009 family protein
MRFSWLTLAAITLALGAGLLTPPPVAAQPPAQAPVLDPSHNRLDELLLHWEQRMKEVQSLAAQVTRTSVDNVFQSTDVYEGKASFKRPNLAMLQMNKKSKPDVFEKYVCTGQYLYEYSQANKVVRIHEMDPPKSGQVMDDNGFLSFLFGMQAAEAKRRYDLTLVKEDQWWIYIRILPRLPADKADFQEARLVLSRQTFLPRELWFKQPNKNEVKWDIPKIDSGAQLNLAEFMSPPVPPGWVVQRVPRMTTATPPRVVRPNR